MTIVRVGPEYRNSSHNISLEADNEKWGINLEGGIRGVIELSQTASTLLQRGGAQKWGDYDPTFGHIQQDTWHGGRGLEEFSDDPSRYFDAQNAWTLTPGRLHPSLRWQFANTDHRDYNQIAFADFEWHSLIGTERYISSKFTVAAQAGGQYDAVKCYVWLRRVGNPGTLTCEIWSDTDGKPVAKQGSATKTVTISTITDTVAVWHAFQWASAETLADGAFHAVIYGASTDSASNHWEVGTNPAGTASHYDDDGSGWTAASYTMYYRVVDADVAVKWHFFMMDTLQLYKVSQPATGNSLLYEWDETSDEWDVCPDLSTDGTDALSGIVKSVAVSGDLAHFARGTGGSDETIFVFDKDGADHKGEDDQTAGNKADVVLACNDPVDGPQIARYENDNNYWSRSDVKALDTDLVFRSDVKFPQGYAHQGLEMAVHNDQVWIRTRSGVWSMQNDRAAILPVGLDAVVETSSYMPMLSKDLFLYIAWSHSLERLYGGTLDDIGPWQGAGLPHGRQGEIAALCSGVGMTFAAIDGGTSHTSSVLAWNGTGYHEIFRAPESGQRIRNVFWQPVSGAAGRLWISCGADSIYIVFPEHTLNPLHDTGMNYVHECVVETATYTMGAERLPKLFKELNFITEGLGTSGNIAVDYKVDEDIGKSTSTWTNITTIYHSPDDVVPLNMGNKRRIRFRLRIRCEDSDKPPKIVATVLECLARTPMKRQWNLRIKISDLGRTKTGAKDHDARDFYKWISSMSGSAKELLMRCEDELMDNIYVVVQPPTFYRKYLNTFQKWLGGTVEISLLEA